MELVELELFLPASRIGGRPGLDGELAASAPLPVTSDRLQMRRPVTVLTVTRPPPPPPSPLHSVPLPFARSVTELLRWPRSLVQQPLESWRTVAATTTVDASSDWSV